MTADEILKALEESEGFYLEVGDWVVAPYISDSGEEVYVSGKYKGPDMDKRTRMFFHALPDALRYALKDGKP